MSLTLPLEEQARQLGIALSHYDIDGNLIHANTETLSYFVNLLQSREKSKIEFDDVFVGREHIPIDYPLSRLNLSSESHFSYQLLNEHRQLLIEQKKQSHPLITLSDLPYGYYELHIAQARKKYKVRILNAPNQAFQPPVLAQKKVWGINVQLYSLRSKQNWGIGDFADLIYLSQHAAQFGADFIGINPLHLLYPANPEWASPYSSSSRRWLNPIYLSIESLPEFKACKTVQSWIQQAEIQAQLEQLRLQDRVDYAAVMQIKLQALEILFTYFKRSRASAILARRKEFELFVTEQGQELLLQGLFNELERQKTITTNQQDEDTVGWLGWRAEWQQLTVTEQQKLLRQYRSKIDFWCWLQWLTTTQLSEVQQYCTEQGMQLGIYGDLAVSSSRGSVDVWTEPDLFLQASVGAPPDPLGPVGQNWNLPPYNPTALKMRGFQPVIDMLRANMRHFGIIRIDHVMGLFRLWLIPLGKNAKEGVYVYYPFEELMAILAIESQRNKCLVIGEDLGTVPNEVREKLNEFSLFSYFVLYFAQTDNQFPLKANFPRNAYATIGTHDVPSLQSFWHCRDLELFAQLGILNTEQLAQKYHQRVVDKQALLNSLHRDRYLADDYQGDALTMAMHDNLNRQIHRYLAESSSQVIGVQLENLISQEISFNLPGTASEYPNWRNKLSISLESMFEDEQFRSFLQLINHARQYSEE